MRTRLSLIPLLVFLSVPFLGARGLGFSDVNDRTPYATSIAALKEKNIISGYPDGTFRPGERINRAEFTKIIVGSLVDMETTSQCDTSSSSIEEMPDAPRGSWFAPYVCIARERGIIEGYPDGTFRPALHINAAEGAAILVRAFSLPSAETPVWYEGYMAALQNNNALPSSIAGADAFLTRGEMAAMIAALLSKSTIAERPFHLAGWIPYWDQEQAFKDFQERASLFQTVSLFWYRLDANGAVTTYEGVDEDKAILDFSHQHGVNVHALIANLPDVGEAESNWDPKRVDRVTNSAAARSAHVKALLDLMDRMPFDGIDIDYESLPGEQRGNFTLFIKELSVALHAKGKRLGIALHPKTSEDNPQEDNGSHAQDWEMLGQYADELYFMTYGEHTSGDGPGPIASLPWVEGVLQYAVEDIGVPEEKIFLGLPLYGQLWRQNANGETVGVGGELTLRNSEEFLRDQKVTMQWDTDAQSPFFTFNGDGLSTVWLENTQSFEAKLALAKRFGISRFALWRLGGDGKEIWQALLD